jgi:hypothetical protein
VLLYRQHEGNLLGAPRGLRASLARAGKVAGNDYRDWLIANTRALADKAALLAPEAAAVVARLTEASAPRGGPARVAFLRDLGLRRQDWRGSALTYLAALFGRA